MKVGLSNRKHQLHSIFQVPKIIAPEDYEEYYMWQFNCGFAALVHLFFLILFFSLGVFSLVFFNIFSILIWVICLVLNGKGKLSLVIILAEFEILAHAIFCVMVLGWDAGFQYYIFTTIIATYSYLRLNKIYYFFMVISASGFIFSYFIGQVPAFAYQIEPTLLRVIYIVNLTGTFLAVLILVFFSIKTAYKAKEAFRAEHKKVEKLLHNILPAPIAARLKADGGIIADRFENATVLFCDIVNFTKMSEQMSATQLVNILNEIFCRLDRITEKYDLEKIKTIGDAYMVAAGIPVKRADHAEAVADFALDMIKELNDINKLCNWKLALRAGINSGPLVAGVIGKKKFIYDLWGDTVNVASRMESSGIPGKIQVTEATYNLLCDKYIFEKRGLIEVKGKDKLMTYLLVSKKE